MWNTGKICMKSSLSYFLIILTEIELENVSLCDIWNLRTVFVNTLTADDKCSFRNGENLPQSIQRQLSKKQKHFSHFFANFLKLSSIFEHFKKKGDPHSLCISEATGLKTRGIQLSKKPCLRTPFDSQHVQGFQPFWNHYDNAFFRFFHHSETNWVGICLSQWHRKS